MLKKFRFVWDCEWCDIKHDGEHILSAYSLESAVELFEEWYFGPDKGGEAPANLRVYSWDVDYKAWRLTGKSYDSDDSEVEGGNKDLRILASRYVLDLKVANYNGSGDIYNLVQWFLVPDDADVQVKPERDKDGTLSAYVRFEYYSDNGPVKRSI